VTALNPEDPLTRQIRLLVYQYLRNCGYFTQLSLASDGHNNVAKIACPDDRSFMTEASWIEDLHKQHDRKLSVMPRPMFGGAMRFSPFCPEMPDQAVGFKNSPNVIHCQTTVEAIRYGIHFRGVHLAKAGGHGLFCGWATELGLGLFQHTRLTIDGRNVLKSRAQREQWVKDGEFQVFAAHHMDCRFDGKEQARTYCLHHKHPLVKKYPMELTMENLDDRRFLEIEAPHLLKEAGLD
jgi:hypothetical protein